MLRLFVASVAAALVLIVAGAVPATAHDALVGSSPSPGQRLASAPGSVVLEFSGDVLTIGAAIIIVDQSGQDWVAGDPEVTGGIVRVPLKAPMPEAGYEIRWRVVSSDGHPISGLIPFTVGDADAYVRMPAAADGTGTPVGREGVEDSRADQPVPRALMTGAGGAALAVALFLLIHFSRRRTRGGSGDSPWAAQSPGTVS